MKEHIKGQFVKQLFEFFDKENISIQDRSKILSSAYRDNREKVLKERKEEKH